MRETEESREDKGEVTMNKRGDFQGHAGLPNGVSRSGDVGPERGEQDKRDSWPGTEECQGQRSKTSHACFAVSE